MPLVEVAGGDMAHGVIAGLNEERVVNIVPGPFGANGLTDECADHQRREQGE